MHISPWIRANAGSGKTTQLTRRVLGLLLQGVPPERIVCITYTKAAANEMRERILKRLRELLVLDDAACRAAIEDYLRTPATEAHLTRARTLFAEMLDSPHGGVQLTTIHGFCQNLLRRFPLEAGLSPHFTVLEEAAVQEVQQRAKYAVLQLESGTPELEHALSLLGERGGEWHFDALASDIIAKRRQWDAVVRTLTPELLQQRIYVAHGLEAEVTAESLAAACRFSEPQLNALRAGLEGLLTHKTEKYRRWGAVLASWLEAGAPATMAAYQPLCDLFLHEDGAPKGKLFNKTDYPEGSPFRAALEEAISLWSRYYSQAIALTCAEESAAIAIIAQTLLQMYAAEKTARQALDYDDLIIRTLALVSQPETLGWVMQKLDHRIDHLLIDEAQDNSREQWKLADVLVEELITQSGGVGAGNLPRSLLVVGDEKQSIYSFQGAAPEQFEAYRARFDALLKHSPAPLKEETLEKSYRSAEAVLQLVDAVSALPEVATAITTHGAPQRHILHRTEESGVVKLYPPIARPQKESFPPMTMPTEYRVMRSATQMLAEEIAATVHRWLQVEKRVLTSESRPLRAGDILILVHRRAPLVMPLLRELQKLGVTVAGIDRLTLSTHLAVRDLLALMQWTTNTSDDLALAQVLRSPLIGMSDEALRAIAHPRTGSLWAEVEDSWLTQVLQQNHVTPYAFLSFVLATSGKRKAFARRFGNEVHEVLDELLAQAAAMPAELAQTLPMFHEWMTKSTRQIKRELDSEQVDAVRIMTVHGAKGLEAPVVILADTVSVPNTGRERSYFHTTPEGVVVPVMGLSEMGKASPKIAQAKEAKKQQLLKEYYRLLYVALTRAKYELHLWGSANEKGEVPPASWYAKLREAMEPLAAADQDGIYTLADVRPAMPVREAATAEPKTLPLPAWAQAPVTMPDAQVQTLSPSRIKTPDTEKGYHAFAGAKARERGVRIHRILELLPVKHDPEIIMAVIRHVCPDWEEAAQVEIAQQVQTLSEQHPWLWQHPRHPEVSVAGSIMHQGREVPVSGSIDLLLDTGHERIIIDFKTSAQVPSEAAQVPVSYILQLKLYRALLQTIDSASPVRCAILWTHQPQLMWLDEIIDATPFPVEKMHDQDSVVA